MDSIAQTATATAAAGGGSLVLVVDDSSQMRLTMQEVLRLDGHRVCLAADGPSAVEAIERIAPRVALVDIGLPGFDGWEVARRARALPQGKQVLLVALSGYDDPEDVRRSHEAGFDHHLVKPVDPRELIDLVGGTGPGRSDRAVSAR